MKNKQISVVLLKNWGMIENNYAETLFLKFDSTIWLQFINSFKYDNSINDKIL